MELKTLPSSLIRPAKGCVHCRAMPLIGWTLLLSGEKRAKAAKQCIRLCIPSCREETQEPNFPNETLHAAGATN
eukprot:135892-Amphidinium_carterae.1